MNDVAREKLAVAINALPARLRSQPLSAAADDATRCGPADAFPGFINRVRSLYNIDHHLLPELSDADWREFRDNPPRYFINKADAVQARAIWREVEKRQRP